MKGDLVNKRALNIIFALSQEGTLASKAFYRNLKVWGYVREMSVFDDFKSWSQTVSAFGRSNCLLEDIFLLCVLRPTEGKINLLRVTLREKLWVCCKYRSQGLLSIWKSRSGTSGSGNRECGQGSSGMVRKTCCVWALSSLLPGTGVTELLTSLLCI